MKDYALSEKERKRSAIAVNKYLGKPPKRKQKTAAQKKHEREERAHNTYMAESYGLRRSHVPSKDS